MRSADGLGLGPARVGQVQAGGPARQHRPGRRASGRGGRAARAVGAVVRVAMRASTYRRPNLPLPAMADSLAGGRRPRSSTCRACPRLVAWREQVAREKRAALRRRGVLGPARARLRRPGRPRRSSSASPRPPTAATAPAGCSPATARATGSTPRCTAPASPTSRPASHRDDGLRLTGAWITAPRPLRAAGQQADARGAGHLPALPRARAGPAAATLRVFVALGQFGYAGAGARPRACGPGPVRPRRRGRRRRRPHDPLLVPREPAEHLHRQAHRAHARRRLRAGPGAGGENRPDGPCGGPGRRPITVR